MKRMNKKYKKNKYLLKIESESDKIYLSFHKFLILSFYKDNIDRKDKSIIYANKKQIDCLETLFDNKSKFSVEIKVDNSDSLIENEWNFHNVQITMIYIHYDENIDYSDLKEDYLYRVELIFHINIPFKSIT
jgi:hypothetical protein